MLPIYLLGKFGIGSAIFFLYFFLRSTIVFLVFCLCMCLTIYSLRVANERSQAVRTRPILVDINGRSFWRLYCYSEESSILVQGKF